jgi:hypothetical protein
MFGVLSTGAEVLALHGRHISSFYLLKVTLTIGPFLLAAYCKTYSPVNLCESRSSSRIEPNRKATEWKKSEMIQAFMWNAFFPPLE